MQAQPPIYQPIHQAVAAVHHRARSHPPGLGVDRGEHEGHAGGRAAAAAPRLARRAPDYPAGHGHAHHGAAPGAAPGAVVHSGPNHVDFAHRLEHGRVVHALPPRTHARPPTHPQQEGKAQDFKKKVHKMF